MCRTRTLAAKLVSAGHVRLNGGRAEDPAKAVRRGDVLTIALARATRVLTVKSAGWRRGPPDEARLLYEAEPEGEARKEHWRRDDASLAGKDDSR